VNDPAKFNVEYDIVDTENPENNQVIASDASPERVMETPEQRIQRMATLLRAQLVMDNLARRNRENERALKPRVKRRRAKNKVGKASRKRNRG
jgi:hypothetical protein